MTQTTNTTSRKPKSQGFGVNVGETYIGTFHVNDRLSKAEQEIVVAQLSAMLKSDACVVKKFEDKDENAVRSDLGAFTA